MTPGIQLDRAVRAYFSLTWTRNRLVMPYKVFILEGVYGNGILNQAFLGKVPFMNGSILPLV